jgi:hypothetical protein
MNMKIKYVLSGKKKAQQENISEKKAHSKVYYRTPHPFICNV